MQTAINSGDTAWLLVSAALVMLMTPGLALFYGGMVQQRNVLSTFMHSFFALGIVSIQWVLIGYSLSFGATHGGVIGGFDFFALKGVGTAAKEGMTVPHILFMAYQGMFAIITPALISGAYAERMKFSAYVLFTLLWTTLVYDPIAHWVWGGGWLAEMRALDFAGGTVVHVSSGVAALVAAMVLGPRLGYPNLRRPPHNLTMTVIGAGLLWFGWFGFNAGSALTAGEQASLAFVNTHVAAAAGAIGWGLVEMMRVGKVTMLGVASGLVAGLVGITPAAGFVGPMGSIAIGLAAGFVCYGGVLLKSRFKYDDALDAFGVHGVGGALGALLTGVFAKKVYGSSVDGVLDGNWKVLGIQALGVAAAAVYSAVVSFVVLKVVDVTVGLRATKDDEREGLDVVYHGEQGYELGGSAVGGMMHGVPLDSEEPAEDPSMPKRAVVADENDPDEKAAAPLSKRTA
jgi:Amt family ammonium transporter